MNICPYCDGVGRADDGCPACGRKKAVEVAPVVGPKPKTAVMSPEERRKLVEKPLPFPNLVPNGYGGASGGPAHLASRDYGIQILGLKLY